MVRDGRELAKKVNPTLARDAEQRRPHSIVILNCIGGAIAEYCWRKWLNREAKRSRLDVVAESNVFESVDRHVDITMTYHGHPKRTVEVRSSYPYALIQNAIYEYFDIIGWYHNPVKRTEVKKDYYVRALSRLKRDEEGKQEYLLDKVTSDGYRMYLTGGATRELLENGPHSRTKEFIPKDDIISALSTSAGKYRVVQPISNSYDTRKITDFILHMKD